MLARRGHMIIPLSARHQVPHNQHEDERQPERVYPNGQIQRPHHQDLLQNMAPPPKYSVIGVHASSHTAICYVLSIDIHGNIVIIWADQSGYSALSPVSTSPCSLRAKQ